MKTHFNEHFLKDYFLKKEDVEFVLLFGSFASGCICPFSDIDVAVYFEDGKAVSELGERQIEITCAIMQLYHINRVDAVILNRANPFLKFQILKYGRLIYARDKQIFYKFKADSFGIYQDIKPMYDLYDTKTLDAFRRSA